MKRLILIWLVGLSLSSSSNAETLDNWAVASSEQQFDNTSSVTYKSTDVVKKSQVTVKSSGLDPANTRQQAKARTLDMRPEVKNASAVFWIYDAWVEFYGDADHDGYFNHFSVEFDADTEFSEAQVYGRLYLGQNDVFKEFHTTDTFSIFGDSSLDSLVVESELLSGFTPGDYEILIELYDEYTHELVAVIDGYNDADLYLVPLESQEYEYVYEDTEVIIVTEHGGSLSWWLLSLIPLIYYRGKRAS